MTYRVVPENLKEREPVKNPRSLISKDLLAGKTVFVTDRVSTWGSYYTLARNHGMKCHSQKINLNGIDGTLLSFESS